MCKILERSLNPNKWGQTGLCYGTTTVQHHDVTCSWILFRTVTLVLQSGTVLTVMYSTLEGCKPKTKVQTDALDKLLYAGDMGKNASSDAKMQRAMDQVSQSCDNYGLTTSNKKD